MRNLLYIVPLHKTPSHRDWVVTKPSGAKAGQGECSWISIITRNRNFLLSPRSSRTTIGSMSKLIIDSGVSSSVSLARLHTWRSSSSTCTRKCAVMSRLTAGTCSTVLVGLMTMCTSSVTLVIWTRSSVSVLTGSGSRFGADLLGVDVYQESRWNE